MLPVSPIGFVNGIAGAAVTMAPFMCLTGSLWFMFQDRQRHRKSSDKPMPYTLTWRGWWDEDVLLSWTWIAITPFAFFAILLLHGPYRFIPFFVAAWCIWRVRAMRRNYRARRTTQSLIRARRMKQKKPGNASR